MKRQYCFTLDDNIRFLEEAVKNKCDSLFDTEYFSMLRRLHRGSGCKIQINMFYSYSPGSFSLVDCPDRFKEELEQNAYWLRFSFHGRHNDPPYPYADNEKALLSDYDDVMRELARIVGKKSLASTTTLHYVAAGKRACRALFQKGVQGLIGMFYDLPGPEALGYFLSREQCAALRKQSFLLDDDTGLYFVRNDLIVNQYSLTVLSAQHLPMLLERALEGRFFQFMIHEQYFYKDYQDYQPDFEKKLELILSHLVALGFESCFLEEALLHEGTAFCKDFTP